MSSKKIYNQKFTDIDGVEKTMENFKGKYILIVNVASECGFTPQYAQLQELYDHYKDVLEIIAFPCNDFGGQEPGKENEIKTFCVTRYNVSFTITSKINILKKPVHSAYEWLQNKSENGVMDTEVRWNFHKFIIDKEGYLTHSFPSGISPFDDQLLAALKIQP